MFFAPGTPQHVVDAGLRQWDAMKNDMARSGSQPSTIRSTGFPQQNSSAPANAGGAPRAQAAPQAVGGGLQFGRAQPTQPPSQGTPYGSPGVMGQPDKRPVNPKPLLFSGPGKGSVGGGGAGGTFRPLVGNTPPRQPLPNNPFGSGPINAGGNPFGGGSPFGGGGGGGGFGGNPFGGGGFGGGSPFGGGGGFGGFGGGNPFGGGGFGGGNPFGGFTPTGSSTTSFGNMPPVNAMPGGAGMSWGFPGSGGGMYQEPRMTFGSPQPNMGPGGFSASYGNPFGGAPTPTPNFAQRDALIQRLNEQMMPYQMGQQAGRPNININQSMADANRMVQGGWSNPFAFR